VLEYLVVMSVFALPFVLFALHKRRFSALGLAAVTGLTISVLWDLISAVLSTCGCGMQTSFFV